MSRGFYVREFLAVKRKEISFKVNLSVWQLLCLSLFTCDCPFTIMPCHGVARPNFICQHVARKCELVAAQAATERIFFEQHLLVSIASLRVVVLFISTMSPLLYPDFFKHSIITL